MNEEKPTEQQIREKERLIELWREYGGRFSVFAPEQQPVPDIWEPQVTEKDHKGRTNPQYLKHWKFLERTKEFIRDRYSAYNVLQGPTLYFDCLVPKFQDRMLHRWALDQHGNLISYEVNDSYEWYENAIRLGIFGWQVGFSCRSLLCERHWCSLHRENPDRISPADIYGLLAAFEDISLLSAKNRVAQWWGVKLDDLERKGIASTQRLRHKVPKKAISDLIARYAKSRAQHVKDMIRDFAGLIRACPMVEWHGRLFDADYAFLSRKTTNNLYRINGPAVKAYVWLLIRQEETARNTKGAKLNVTDAELAQELGVSKPTAAGYRESLFALGLIEAHEEILGKEKAWVIRKAKY